MQKSVSSLYTKNKLLERDIKKIIYFNCIKKSKIPRNKFNQEDERPVLEKHSWKELRMTQTNVKIHGTHGLILLKCPYYPKQYTDANGIFNKTRTTVYWRGSSLFILYSWWLCWKLVDGVYFVLFLGSLFCSIGLYANTILFWFLWLCNIVWNHVICFEIMKWGL